MENIKYKNILLKFYVLLLEKLDPNEVSVQLLTVGVLTSDDKEKVEEKSSQREKSEDPFPNVPVPKVSFGIYLIFIRDTYSFKEKNT